MDGLIEGRTYKLTFYPYSKNKNQIAGPYKVKFVGYGRTKEGGNPESWQRFVEVKNDGTESPEFALNNERLIRVEEVEANAVINER